MKQSDDVFFFTLIDFLLQVFFFGLLLFVVSQAVQAKVEAKRVAVQAEGEAIRTSEMKQKDGLLKVAGVSSITELTDRLTKMAPLDRLQGSSDFIARHGGEKVIEAAVAATNASGGVEKVAGLRGQVEALSDRIGKLEGWGKVSCIPNVLVNGKLQPKSIATATVSDDGITLENPSAEMMTLLGTLGLEFSGVQQLSLSAFRSTFARVVSKQPECRYFLNVVTRTRYLEPMRTVWSAFRTQ